MKTSALKSIIKEAVREAIQEELKDILLEAVKTPKITTITPNSYIETELRFLKPFESTSTGFFNIKQVEGGTEVAWGFKGNNTFPTTLMMVFMDMDKAITRKYGENEYAALLKLN